jgi:two-component system, NarL family, response regulator DesR
MIVEEVDLLRGALVAFLAAEADLTVVSGLSYDDNVVAHAVDLKPDVVVLGTGRLEGQAVRVAGRLAREAPASRLLIIATAPSVETLKHALDAQVLGFLGTNVSPEQLAVAIREVAAGRRMIDRSISAALSRSVANPLTDREIEVLRIASQGIPSNQIAERLRLAPGTVRNYLSNIMRKTGTDNRTQAIRHAREAGWL